MNYTNNVIHGDCLDIMNQMIQEGIKVDAIITDIPYGTTACKWDIIIPFDEMWDKIRQLRKDNTPIVLFGDEPFSSSLRLSNIKEYKYDWVWNKVSISNPMISKKQPLKNVENICVFYKKQCTYNPQMTKGTVWKRGGSKSKHSKNNSMNIYINRECEDDKTDLKYPKRIIEISNANRNNLIHPTQKPVALLEYLIKTYTNEGDVILDFTIGSGTTAISCINTNRNFIGIEKDYDIYHLAKDRINTYILENKIENKYELIN